VGLLWRLQVLARGQLRPQVRALLLPVLQVLQLQLAQLGLQLELSQVQYQQGR
jgi:hypothetical protein